MISQEHFEKLVLKKRRQFKKQQREKSYIFTSNIMDDIYDKPGRVLPSLNVPPYIPHSAPQYSEGEVEKQKRMVEDLLSRADLSHLYASNATLHSAMGKTHPEGHPINIADAKKRDFVEGLHQYGIGPHEALLRYHYLTPRPPQTATNDPGSSSFHNLQSDPYTSFSRSPQPPPSTFSRGASNLRRQHFQRQQFTNLGE